MLEGGAVFALRVVCFGGALLALAERSLPLLGSPGELYLDPILNVCGFVILFFACEVVFVSPVGDLVDSCAYDGNWLFRADVLCLNCLHLRMHKRELL